MKITEPYSPTAREKPSATPVRSVGQIDGSTTQMKLWNLEAPRVSAARSTSRSRSPSTGCSVRTTNGRLTNASATTMPSGVYATRIPSGSSSCPIQPLGAYRAVRAMPATAVGSANGRSMMASNSRRPGKRWRVKAQAMMNPNTALIAAASSAAPKLRRSEASTRGVVTTCQNLAGPSSAERRKAADRGSSTISDTYSSVHPIVRPNPGSTRNARRLRRLGVACGGCGRVRAAPCMGLLTVDLVEGAAIVEMLGLCLLPAAERIVDGHQLEARKLAGVPAGDVRIARPVETARDDVLALGAV